MAPPTVMIKVPIPAPIQVPAAPVVDSKTAEVTEPRPEPIAPTQFISGPFFSFSFAISPTLSITWARPCAITPQARPRHHTSSSQDRRFFTAQLFARLGL